MKPCKDLRTTRLILRLKVFAGVRCAVCRAAFNRGQRKFFSCSLGKTICEECFRKEN
jgi:hypothetical protein